MECELIRIKIKEWFPGGGKEVIYETTRINHQETSM